MNLADYKSYGNDLNYIGFNQNKSCYVIAMADGFRIFHSDPLRLTAKHTFEEGGLMHAEMLLCTNYLALVGGTPRAVYPPDKVVIFDSLKKMPSIVLDVGQPVIAVRLRRDRIVVAIEGFIRVYTFTQPPELVNIFEASTNAKGICELCVDGNCSTLAFPARYDGHVQVVDLAHKQRKPIEIKAHTSTISCLSLNNRGKLLATSSEKGTLIRIFETEKGQLVNEVRRGTIGALIYCINFNHDSSMIVVSSDHGTIHVFDLRKSNKNNNGGNSAASQVFNFSKYLSSQWSFAKISIPNSPRCVCAFGTDPNSIIVVCADGSYYKYLFNKKGEIVCDMCTKFLEIEY